MPLLAQFFILSLLLFRLPLLFGSESFETLDGKEQQNYKSAAIG